MNYTEVIVFFNILQLIGLESLPQADSEEEANFIMCVVSLVKKIRTLDKMVFH